MMGRTLLPTTSWRWMLRRNLNRPYAITSNVYLEQHIPFTTTTKTRRFSSNLRPRQNETFLFHRWPTQGSCSSCSSFYYRKGKSNRYFSPSSPISSNNYLHSKYQQLVDSGQLSQDSHQLHAIDALERLRNELMAMPAAAVAAPPKSHEINNNTYHASSSFTASTSSSSSWDSWWSSSSTTTTTTTSSSLNSALFSTTTTNNSIRGVYLHGGVGCGKSFLMHLFHDSLSAATPGSSSSSSTPARPTTITKQFVHYHKFMLDIHRELHVAKTKQKLQGDEAVAHVVRQIRQAGQVLCCDEFQVTDIADAMLLVRLLPLLWQAGCILVATSNRAPSDLYAQGLQRDLFVPLIHQLTQRCQVVSMEASETDYRVLIQQKQQQQQQSLKAPTSSSASSSTKSSSSSSSSSSMQDLLQKPYFVGKASRKDFHELFYQVTQGASVAPMSLYVSASSSSSSSDSSTPTIMNRGARKVNIPWACPDRHICRFAFEDLCAKALGAADYMVLASHFNMIFVEQIPALTATEINWLRRFITFCDTMYDAHVVLVLQAAVPLDQLLQVPDDQLQQLKRAHDEFFAFDRTKSRLQEMTSTTYIADTSTKWIPPVSAKSSSSNSSSRSSSQQQQQQTTIAFREVRVEPSLADDASR